MTVASDAQLYALVPCAGVGGRAATEGPKQYALLAGRPVIAHMLAALACVPAVSQTLVVLAPDDALFEAAVPAFDGWAERCGGATRAASVRAGLAELVRHGARPDDWVLVHDAARCLVQPAWIERLIDACRGDAVGGLLALPIADTLKDAMTDANEAQRVFSTIDRRGKWAAQTPQMFRLGLLMQALDTAGAAGDAVTDEAGAVEALGHAPRLVPGDADNFKLTWPEDFQRAERLLAHSGNTVKAFVPARDFARSLAFYGDLGFVVEREFEGVVALRRGSAAFLLQDFFVQEHASNFMMAMQVDDLDTWAVGAARVAAHYDVRFDSPEMRPWGLRDCVLIDPTGVLWRVTQRAGLAEVGA